jgi:hypothetical protein
MSFAGIAFTAENLKVGKYGEAAFCQRFNVIDC